MAVPKLLSKSIEDALKYIDEHGVPNEHKSTTYLLNTNNGNKYPPKYVIAVANHLENGEEIKTDYFNAIEAKKFFITRGYTVEDKHEKYELIITSKDISSSDDRFDINNLNLGDGYKPIEAYFKAADGSVVKRKKNKSENRISNQTLPRLAFQIYEKQISSLSDWDRAIFPICKYNPESEVIKGIFQTVEAFLKYKNSMEHMTYYRENGPKFVIYSWNVFSTLIFVQECLKRFGDEGDSFVLVYRDKTEHDSTNIDLLEEVQTSNEIQNPYSKVLLKAKNIIFRGAPGTGKSYIAKEVAADIISDGLYDKYCDLSDEQKEQIEFVQFHPSYDYSDFVEGLRPVMKADGTMGFELQEGIFMRFVNKARENYENSLKSQKTIEKEQTAKETLFGFLSSVNFGVDKFKTITGNEFYIMDANEKYIDISIPGNENIKSLKLNIEEIRKMLESGINFEKINDITNLFNKKFATQAFSYDFALFKAIKEKQKNVKKVKNINLEKLKKYIFIIDEINRGEISKILGELFFAIDPGYRGKEGAVSTQYANMHEDTNNKFYVPENVYIIGTMNDIDRSVDSFDFAMRRRFRFIEIKAEDSASILDGTILDEEIRNEANKRMAALNKEIKNVPDLNENYQIGAAYFLKLKDMTFDELWTDCLHPVLQDYIRGMYDEDEIMKRFEKAYGYSTGDNANED